MHDWDYGADEIAYPPAEGSPKGRLRGVRICRGEAGASEMRPYQCGAAGAS